MSIAEAVRRLVPARRFVEIALAFSQAAKKEVREIARGLVSRLLQHTGQILVGAGVVLLHAQPSEVKTREGQMGIEVERAPVFVGGRRKRTGDGRHRALGGRTRPLRRRRRPLGVPSAELEHDPFLEDQHGIARKSSERLPCIPLGLVEPCAAAEERNDEAIPVQPDRVGVPSFAAPGRRVHSSAVTQLNRGLMGKRAQNRGPKIVDISAATSRSTTAAAAPLPPRLGRVTRASARRAGSPRSDCRRSMRRPRSRIRKRSARERSTRNRQNDQRNRQNDQCIPARLNAGLVRVLDGAIVKCASVSPGPWRRSGYEAFRAQHQLTDDAKLQFFARGSFRRNDVPSGCHNRASGTSPCTGTLFARKA